MTRSLIWCSKDGAYYVYWDLDMDIELQVVIGK